MRVYAIVNLNESIIANKVKMFADVEEAFDYFEDYIHEHVEDEDERNNYINEMNYEDKVFLVERDIPTNNFANLQEFLKFTSLMDDLGLDTQTAIRIFVKKCLATQSIPFEIKN